ncbi:MAG TPA: hypothetical protein VMF03_09200 [Steroidobacteraceae bacterium]|nr:hypothetical protein [Steroidobacteraceae bacterium]
MPHDTPPARGLLPALFAAALLFSTCAGAACVLPAPPSHVPDGRSANEQEMLAAEHIFKQYNDDVDEYTKCLEFEGRRNLITFDEQVKYRSAALATLAAVVGHFNEQVRIFRARHS